MSAARGLEDKSASFVGSINVAGVAYDSQTGEVLAAAQAIISPSSLNLTSGLTPLRAAELSTTKAAEAFRDYLARTVKR
jgi:nucleoside recognition membrane protein YjiH